MITLHHLNFSRSTRVIWLMEELELRYRLVRYERDANFRAPAALKAVHPLGKAPVIEDEGLILAESAAILRHIDRRHGDGRFSPAGDGGAAAIHDEWLQYAESSAAFPIMTTLIGSMTGGLPPGLQAFAGPELALTLDYIGDRLAEGPYLMGEAFTLADIQMSYLVAVADHGGMLAGRTPILDYRRRLEARPACALALDVGGPMTPPSR